MPTRHMEIWCTDANGQVGARKGEKKHLAASYAPTKTLGNRKMIWGNFARNMSETTYDANEHMGEISTDKTSIIQLKTNHILNTHLGIPSRKSNYADYAKWATKTTSKIRTKKSQIHKRSAMRMGSIRTERHHVPTKTT